MLPWFRMYQEFSKDPKVQSMSEALQRRLVMIFCLQCSEELQSLSDDELAHALRITPDELVSTLEIFREKGFLDHKRRLRNWNKRQFKSDVSTERVRAFRERSGNVSETQMERPQIQIQIQSTETDNNNSKALSGKPDADSISGKKLNGTSGHALEVLQFLNEKTRRKFRGLDGRGRPTPNLKFIMARLESGASVQDCKTVVARKFRDWAADDKMRSYLRPETLFNATKFEQYLGECTTEEMPRE